MVTVTFNDPDEFLAEMALEANEIADRVVRVTCSRRRGQFTTMMHVVATFVVSQSVVRLDRSVGEYMHHSGPDFKEVAEKADKLADHIRAEAKRLGLETRAGVYTLNPVS